jgi:hypothetical protein
LPLAVMSQGFFCFWADGSWSEMEIKVLSFEVDDQIVMFVTGESCFSMNTDSRAINKLFASDVFSQVIQKSFIFEPKLGTITSNCFLLISSDLDLLNFL